jgi:hypothetical protein
MAFPSPCGSSSLAEDIRQIYPHDLLKQQPTVILDVIEVDDTRSFATAVSSTFCSVQ